VFPELDPNIPESERYLQRRSAEVGRGRISIGMSLDCALLFSIGWDTSQGREVDVGREE